MTAGDIWSEALTRIQTKVNRHTFLTWFYPTSLLTDRGFQLAVLVPNALFTQYLTRQFSNVIAEALTEVGRPGSKVRFIADEAGDVQAPDVSLPEWAESAEAQPPVAGTPEPGVDAFTQSVHPGLNPRYTFDSFVVGPSNQFSHAACQAVAEAPSRSYNPLYIYGGVGLGKTHLMHAVGHYVLAHNPSARLTYISTERFMNEMIHGMRSGAMLDFRERYRTVDLLLVDDIQYLAGREGTQNEFFHTFNALHDAQKQIVLSSDCPPQEIPSIEDRLRSRFTWGLIADIQPPDLETKVAILKKKAEAESVPLPDGVAIYIAEKIKSNIRELEGSLIRLIAFASLTGREITVSLAQEVLRGIFGREDKAVTIEIVQKFVADHYKLKATELKSRNNSKSVAMPRQIAMYLSKKLTSASLPEIGRSFGGKHHSTVIHSIKKVESLRARDRDFNNLMNTFMESFH